MLPRWQGRPVRIAPVEQFREEPASGRANSAPGRLDEQVEKAKKFLISLKYVAQMAELVDALVSGTSVRKYVQVRVLFWAPESL